MGKCNLQPAAYGTAIMQVSDTQLKHNDCGISVIKTLCNIHKADISRAHVESAVFLDSQGCRLGDITHFFDQHGFETSVQLLDLNLKDDQYYQAKLPFVLPVRHKGSAHFVTVRSYKKGRFEVLDPLELSPYYLSRSELRKRAYHSANNLSYIDTSTQTAALCSQLLAEYEFDAKMVCNEISTDHLFNKITYFLYIRDEFGFKDHTAERNFLNDILFNQDILQLPQQFMLLKIDPKALTITAPVILSVKRHPTSKILEAPAKQKEKNAFLSLYAYLGGHKNTVLLYIAIALASVSFTQLYVFINQYFLDDILAVKNSSVITIFILALISYKIFELALYLGKKWLGISLSINLDNLFLKSFDAKLNQYSLAFIQEFKRGDLTERLSDATKLKAFFTKYLINILVDSAVSVYILGVLLYLNWKLAGIVIVVMGLFYLWFKQITPYLQRNEQIRFTRKSDFFSSMLEKLEGIQTLKCLRYDSVFSQKITANIESLLSIHAKTQKLDLLNSLVTALITITATVILIAFLSHESVALNTMTLGQVVTFLTLSSRVFSSLGGLLNENLTVQENQIILKRYFSFNEPQPPEEPYRPFSAPLESMALDAVSFGYHPDESVLKKISFTVNRGDKIRIEGKNGSGKSTLSKVIALLYPARSGNISINNADLSTFCQKAVKEKILLVSNEDALFNESLLYNLTFQNAVWDERIDILAKGLGIDAWISKKKSQQYSINERGKNLSTGQRKKILLLRALLHNAELIIFDEVLSGIDTESRKHIESYLDTVTDKIFIFISHESITGINFTKTYKIEGKHLHLQNHGQLKGP